MKAAFTEVDITPTPPMRLGRLGANIHLAESVHSPLKFRLALFDDGATRAAPTPATGQTPDAAPRAPRAAERTIYSAWPFDATEATRRQRETAKALGVGVEDALDLGGGVKMDLVLIPAGQFMMGGVRSAPDLAESSKQDIKHFLLEHPRHRVRITRPFYIGKYETTQLQYERVVGKNPSFYIGPQLPVESAWMEAAKFCETLSRQTRRSVRLPTEAEWEYACRAGTATAYPWGDSRKDGDGWANLADKRARSLALLYSFFEWDDRHRDLAPVGQYRANAFGLHDVIGNLGEWCKDRFAANYYAVSPEADPRGPEAGDERVYRGGTFRTGPFYSRSAARFSGKPTYGGPSCAIRVVVEIPTPAQ
jgi:formylglycine-generating enzyme required for sulfatase activity